MDVDPPCILRVIKGTPSAEEIAALVIVLLTRGPHSRDRDAVDCQRSKTSWNRLERSVGFDSPRTWQHPGVALW